MTPVIRGAEKKSLLDISAEMKDLTARARARKLRPRRHPGRRQRDLQFRHAWHPGIRRHHQPPHATILAVGAGARRPVETEDGGVRFVSQMTVTLSCDHRVVDGALGAELLAAFRHFIEHPVGLMI